MKINRKNAVLGLVGLGIAAALAGGVGVAQAAGPTPTPPTTAVYGPGAGMRGMAGMHAVTGAQGTCLSAAATYLGLSESDLQSRLRDGKSFADVAKEKGKSVSGLQDAMIAAAKKALDADTTLTAEQKADRLEQIKSRITTMIDREHGPGMGYGRQGGRMHGGQR